MRYPESNDRVRLTEPVSILWLQCGDVGVVLSIWHSSPEFCEVEFRKPGESSAVRALIRADHLEVIEGALDSRPLASTTRWHRLLLLLSRPLRQYRPLGGEDLSHP